MSNSIVNNEDEVVKSFTGEAEALYVSPAAVTKSLSVGDEPTTIDEDYTEPTFSGDQPLA